MHVPRHRTRSSPAARHMTIRQRVLAVIQHADKDSLLTGAQIALTAGVSYQQTIFALNALLDSGRIERVGRKFTARWRRVQPRHDAIALLEAAFFRGIHDCHR